MDRRHFLSLAARALPAAALTGAGAGTYAIAVEPVWVDLREVAVPVAGLPAPLDGLRIAQLSDIHRSEIVSGRFVGHAVDMVQALQPDLVVLTGDFITKDASFFGTLARELAPLPKIAPTFAVTGNHDYIHYYRWDRPALPVGGDRLADAFDAVGIELLRNARRDVALRGGTLEVVGLEDFWSTRFDAAAAFAGAAHGPLRVPRLVLAHNPDTFNALGAFAFDLMLSGHTHGGQVRFPLLGAPLVPIEDRRFIAGLVGADGRQVYVNRGLGFNRRIRFGVRPEVTLLRLEAAPGALWTADRTPRLG